MSKVFIELKLLISHKKCDKKEKLKKLQKPIYACLKDDKFLAYVFSIVVKEGEITLN